MPFRISFSPLFLPARLAWAEHAALNSGFSAPRLRREQDTSSMDFSILHFPTALDCLLPVHAGFTHTPLVGLLWLHYVCLRYVVARLRCSLRLDLHTAFPVTHGYATPHPTLPTLRYVYTAALRRSARYLDSRLLLFF